MKNEKTVADAETRLDALLAGTPVEPSADFSRRVFSALADARLDEKLSESPLGVPADFSERVMQAIATDSAKNVCENDNVVAFPRVAKFFCRTRFAFAGTAVAAAVAVALGLFVFRGENLPEPLSDRVEVVINSDPELARLAAVGDDEQFSYDDLLAASQLLTVLNENTAAATEFFAYYEN